MSLQINTRVSFQCVYNLFQAFPAIAQLANEGQKMQKLLNSSPNVAVKILSKKCRKTSWKWSDRTCNLHRELGMSTAQQLPWSMHHRSCSDLNEAKAKKCHLFAMFAMFFGIMVSWILHEICWYMLIADVICWIHRSWSCTSYDMNLYDYVISFWMRSFAYWRRGLMCSTRGWTISAWICMMLGREATHPTSATCTLDV